MSIESLFHRFSHPEVVANDLQLCPNCWGYSQWDQEDIPLYFSLDKGQCSEVSRRNGFIRRFVKKYLG